MKSKVADVTGEVRGDKFTVRVEAMVCPKCGFQILTEEQSAAYTIAIADAYRTAHGLLTTDELKDARTRMRMSQRELARFLRVGIASVKRWEAGLIQDEAMDQLIRLRTDIDAARRNLQELQQRTEQSCDVQHAEIIVARLRKSSEDVEWTSPLLKSEPMTRPLITDFCPSA